MLHPLEILKDRISHSETHEIGAFLSTEEISLLRQYIPNLNFYISELSKLSIVYGTTLNILDYDDTLHPRHYELQRGLLQDNRGEKGNSVMENEIGLETMLKSHYHPDSIVSRIANILGEQDDYHRARIFTAGRKSWQHQKLQHSEIFPGDSRTVVVPSGADKIAALLDGVLKLGYIPSKIIVYEDKPEHFKKTAEVVSKLLGGVEIVVNHVILSQREVIKKQIEEIRQDIYVREK